MLTAYDILHQLPPTDAPPVSDGLPSVGGSTEVSRLLDALASSPRGSVAVVNPDGDCEGVITVGQMLAWMSRNMLPARADASWIVAECAPSQYSASRVAHAVEDADAHLLDLFTSRESDSTLRVFIRVALLDPTSAARSLERYGYEIIDYRAADGGFVPASRQRLDQLSVFLNI